MHRIEYSRYGGPEELRLAHAENGTPGRGQILVAIKAASANPMDWKMREGALKMMTGRKFPRGVGNDFAGIVEGVGPGVKRFKVGDAVFGAMTPKGASSFAETIVTNEDTAALKPRSLSFEDAATLPIAGATAWTALIDIAKMKSGQRIFVNGCLGGVGRCATQLARVHGVEVVGACGAGTLDEARALGVSEASDYKALDLSRYRKQFDVVLDTAGTLSPDQCLSILNSKGIALHIAATPRKVLRVLLTPRNKIVFAKVPPAVLDALGRLAEEGKLKLPISALIPLGEAIAAITRLETSGQPKGKLVIVPG